MAGLVLLNLPIELILRILHELDLPSLVRCRQICTLLRDKIDGDVVLQYKIELVTHGMEDSPQNALTVSDRLQRLQRHTEAWRSIRCTSSDEVHMGGRVGMMALEMRGGVLAHLLSSNTGDRKIGMTFTQLPSELRGIPHRTWNLTDLGTDVTYCTMDPSQDLLVLVGPLRSRENDSEYTLHLRKLSSGETHPEALLERLQYLTSIGDDWTHRVRVTVFGDYLGLLVGNEYRRQYEVVIWEWKTGLVVLNIEFSSECDFAFVSPRQILILSVRPSQPHPDGTDTPKRLALTAVDFKTAPCMRYKFEDVQFTCEFEYPPLATSGSIWKLSLSSDPPPGWTPPSDPQAKVPFHKGRYERLLVVSIRYFTGTQDSDDPISHFIPLVAIRPLLEDSVSSVGRRIPWEEWGPRQTRMCLVEPGVNILGGSDFWVYAMSHVFLIQKSAETRTIVIWNFDQLAVRKEYGKSIGKEGGMNATPSFNFSSAAIQYGVFREPVNTSLPFQRWELDFQESRVNRTLVPFLSEDSVILMDGGVDKYRVLNF
ncbi:hypothetical protein BXZ70DRAFT_1063531 [Cristinia sonorae]|uniref:F-box domain-containing protein n=1 Tax=Cristinia sonorae TaxID=1940300 RepID=A0A8K0XRN8_9AGAR|nr:hypothetical protein BXZ70DRAFT_1063531 [Cristinia sonorae]